MDQEQENGIGALVGVETFDRSQSLSVVNKNTKFSKIARVERERTFIMIKPDGVQRGFVGKIIKRFEKKGFQMNAMKLILAQQGMLEKYYEDLKDKDFFTKLIAYVGSGPICCMVWEGTSIISIARQMLGETDPEDSKVGTIRFDLCIKVERNVCDTSKTLDDAKREIPVFFEEKELVSWNNHSNDQVYE